MTIADADAALRLTPQEKALYQLHLVNLTGPGGVDNADGTRSTLRIQIDEIDGRFYLVPTVRDGKVLDTDQTFSKSATAQAIAEGLDKLPSYTSHEEARARYAKIHDFMDRDTAEYQRNQQPTSAQKPIADQITLAAARARISEVIVPGAPLSSEKQTT